LPENFKDQSDFLLPWLEEHAGVLRGRNLVYSQYMFVLVLAIAAVEPVAVASMRLVVAAVGVGELVEAEGLVAVEEVHIVLGTFVVVGCTSEVMQVVELLCDIAEAIDEWEDIVGSLAQEPVASVGLGLHCYSKMLHLDPQMVSWQVLKDRSSPGVETEH
jgi:hypothetical protein